MPAMGVFQFRIAFGKQMRMRTTTVVCVLPFDGAVRAAIPTELLKRLMNAMPEQHAAVTRLWGGKTADEHGRSKSGRSDAA